MSNWIEIGQNASHRVEPGFASLTFDWVNFMHMNKGPAGWLLDSRRLTAVRGLLGSTAPATVLRIGGTTGDRIWYAVGGARGSQPPNAHYSVVVNEAQVTALCKFAAAADLRLIIGLNGGPGPRKDQLDGKWNSTNAVELLNFLDALSCPVLGYELGNEPNLFVLNFGVDGFVSASTLAQDFVDFKKILDAREKGRDLLLIGPDVAFQFPWIGEIIPDYWSDFFAAVGRGVLNAATWHWYPLQSNHCPLWFVDPRYATPSRMVEVGTLDLIHEYLAEVSAAVPPGTVLWLGETAGASCGGQQNVSDALSGTLWYADQLGALHASPREPPSRTIQRSALFGRS